VLIKSRDQGLGKRDFQAGLYVSEPSFREVWHLSLETAESLRIDIEDGWATPLNPHG